MGRKGKWHVQYLENLYTCDRYLRLVAPESVTCDHPFSQITPLSEETRILMEKAASGLNAADSARARKPAIKNRDGTPFKLPKTWGKMRSVVKGKKVKNGTK